MAQIWLDTASGAHTSVRGRVPGITVTQISANLPKPLMLHVAERTLLCIGDAEALCRSDQQTKPRASATNLRMVSGRPQHGLTDMQ